MINFNQKKNRYQQKHLKASQAEPIEIDEFNCPAKDKFLINDKNIILEYSKYRNNL